MVNNFWQRNLIKNNDSSVADCAGYILYYPLYEIFLAGRTIYGCSELCVGKYTLTKSGFKKVLYTLPVVTYLSIVSRETVWKTKAGTGQMCVSRETFMGNNNGNMVGGIHVSHETNQITNER